MYSLVYRLKYINLPASFLKWNPYSGRHIYNAFPAVNTLQNYEFFFNLQKNRLSIPEFPNNILNAQEVVE